MAGILLWENPNENASMPETLITLSSADYDYYEIYYKQIVSNKRMMHQKAFKGYDCFLNFASVSGSGSMSNRRVVYFVSDTSMNIGTGGSAVGASLDYLNNDVCIPVRIIGYKS